MGKARILYITFDGLTDPLGQSQVLPYVLGLAGKGWQMTVLSCEKSPATGQAGASVASALRDRNVEWVQVPYYRRPPLAGQVLNYFRMKRQADRLHREKPFGVVHGRSYLASVIGMQMQRVWGLKYIFDMRGFWPDERKESGLWSRRNPVHRLLYAYFKQKEKQLLRSADAVVSLTFKAADELNARKVRLDRELPLSVIPCCVDTELFSPMNIQTQQRPEALKLPDIPKDRMVMAYLGSIGTWYMLPEMMRFFARLLLRYPDALFLLITPEAPSVIQAEAARQGVPGKSIAVTCAGRPEVPTLLADCRLSLFFIRPVYSKIASSPTKFAEVLAMGIPVVCNSGIGDLDEMIVSAGTGLLVNEFSDAEYDRVIQNLEPLLHVSPAAIRQTVLDHFSLETGIARYHKIYLSLTTP